MQHRWLTVACLVVCLTTNDVNSFVAVVNQPSAQSRRPRISENRAPEMTKLEISSDILYRYAKTSVASRLVNGADVAREISFNVVLPKSAFISAFHIELNGAIYNAYVKEKEEAKKQYSQAVRQGWTAAKVDLSVRDSNRFAVSVNVEARAKVTFNLTYEELLTRRLGTYNHVINIDPGQIVPELRVRVRIQESNTLASLRVPTLRVSNEIDASAVESARDDPLAVIERPDDNIALITWSPTPDQQRDLRDDGVQGQLTVQYDIDRVGNSSQILVSDGYFVHFYAPVDLEPLKKHVVFVLDVSGSMEGQKLDQLKAAMKTVLSDLQEGDFFSVIIFSTGVHVWNPLLSRFTEIDLNKESELDVNFIVSVNQGNISQAKEYVGFLFGYGGRNINDALMVGLELVKLGRKTLKTPDIGKVPEPMIVFLTDGEANVGQRDNDVIVREVTKRNKGQTPIYSLSFGHDANKDFLKKLSLKNSAFSRLIYEGSDAALQLEDFYRQVASPLLANVTFAYLPESVFNDSLTSLHFNTLFRGGELVVAGKIAPGNQRMRGVLMAKSLQGKSRYGFPEPQVVSLPSSVNQSASGFMEKLWAHLNIQQLLDQQAREEGEDSPSKTRALQLALKYSFVTALTSLVVVKPHKMSRADSVDASQGFSRWPAVESGSAKNDSKSAGSFVSNGQRSTKGNNVKDVQSRITNSSSSGGSPELNRELVAQPGRSVTKQGGYTPANGYISRPYASNAYAPKVYAPNVNAPNGYSPVYVPNVYAPNVYASNGYAPNGYAPNGYAPNVYPPVHVPNVYAPNGYMSGGYSPGIASGRGQPGITSYPGSASVYPGIQGTYQGSGNYPSNPTLYPGGPAIYQGRPGIYEVGGHYPGNTGTYPSRPGTYPGRSSANVGQPSANPRVYAPAVSASGVRVQTVTSSGPLTLKDFNWPNGSFNVSHVTFHSHNGVRTYRVGANEPDTSVPCTSVIGRAWSCRHLQYCLWKDLRENFQVYSQTYFCVAPGGFAGVCCPTDQPRNNMLQRTQPDRPVPI